MVFNKAVEIAKDAKEKVSNLSKTAQFVKPVLDEISANFEGFKNANNVVGNVFQRIDRAMTQNLNPEHPEVVELHNDLLQIKSTVLTETLKKILLDPSNQIYQVFYQEFVAEGLSDVDARNKVREKATNTVHNYFAGVMDCLRPPTPEETV
ncbi:hypothetical protein ACFL21_01315 [Patescibacteria group bacterium]